MKNETLGRMERCLPHDLSYKDVLRKEKGVKEFQSDTPRMKDGECHNNERYRSIA